MVDGDLTELVHRAVEGDQSAWDSITDRFNNLLWAIARSHRLNAADAEDVVQTTWLRLVEHLDRIRDPERLAGWLSATARHECLNVLRRSGREVVTWNADETYDPADQQAAPVDQNLLEDERDRELWLAFGLLPDRCQALLRVLVSTDPSSYAEVTKSFGMPTGSIGPTRMRCLERLRRILSKAETSFELSKESRLP